MPDFRGPETARPNLWISEGLLGFAEGGVLGDSDVLPQAQAELLVKRLPRGTLAVIPGAGHSVIGDNPQQSIAEVMPFLASKHVVGASRL